MRQITINDFPIVIAIPICCVLVAVLRYLRRKFPVTVNCWFCRTNCRVPYNEWNSFTCTSCKQYNGFKEDGDYNKIIPEQHEELLNHIVPPIKSKSSSLPSNGLCQRCNENQQLKVFQLTHFVPLDEDNYDREIEHFEKQLEKSYVLCKRCQSTVKQKIFDVNRTLLAKQIDDIRRSGKTLLNHASSNKLLLNRIKRVVFCLLLSICIGFAIAEYYNMKYLQILWQYRYEIAITSCISMITSIVTYCVKIKLDAQNLLVKGKSGPVSTSSCEKRRSERFIRSSHTLLQSRSFNSTSYENDSDSSAGSELGRLNCHSSPVSFNTSLPLPSKHVFTPLQCMNTSFRSAPSQLPHHDINDAIGRLHLENIGGLPSIGTKSVATSPTSFRNPWTGKAWNRDSRSSSQSSGIASRSTSIYGEDVAEVASRLPRHLRSFSDRSPGLNKSRASLFTSVYN